LSANSNAMAFNFLRTFFRLNKVPCVSKPIITSNQREPQLLPGHDESPSNVSIFNESFAIRQAQLLREVQSGHSRSVWHLVIFTYELLLVFTTSRNHSRE
jgi:hypothetical protein